MDEVDGATIEGNLFDHNGWNAQIAAASPTIFNHNMYLQYTDLNVNVIGNISAEASSHGLQVRTGGVIEGNLFIDDPIAMLIGNTSGYAGNPTVVSGNVILNGVDMATNPASARGFGIDVNPTPSTIIQGNIIADSLSAAPGYAIAVDGGISNTIQGNVVYNWG